MIEKQLVTLEPDKYSDPTHKPTLTKWKGVDMIRAHAIRSPIAEIVRKSKNRDVIKVGIIGEPHTGKSTQADTIAHLIHTMSKKMYNIDFAVRSYNKDAFVDIKGTLSNLTPANYILKFGDLSFLKASYGAKKVAELEQATTEIRHLPGGRDVKIIIIYDYHYTKGLPPYLRQSDFKFFTGVGSSEKENMEEIVSHKYYSRMLKFKKLSDKAPSTEKVVFQLGNKGFFTYQYKNPFIPMAFWNEEKLRIVMSPTREWIDPICPTCSISDNTFSTDMDIDNLLKEGHKRFGFWNFEAAIKLKLKANGIDVYNRKVVNSGKWLDLIMEKKRIKLEDIAVKCGFEQTKTRLREKIDDMIQDAPKEAT